VEPLGDATGHALEGGALGTEGEGTPLPRDHLLDVVHRLPGPRDLAYTRSFSTPIYLS